MYEGKTRNGEVWASLKKFEVKKVRCCKLPSRGRYIRSSLLDLVKVMSESELCKLYD